jgi:hypothetical protein
MKWSIIILVIYFVSLSACKKEQKEIVDVCLSYSVVSDIHWLTVTVVNNSDTSMYLPVLSNSDDLYYGIKIFDLNGKRIQHERQPLFVPPDDFRIKNNGCKEELSIMTLEDLDYPPFTQRKKGLRNLIQNEYDELMSSIKCRDLTIDIYNLKMELLYKYKSIIFLKPGDYYSQCISINHILENNKSFYAFIELVPQIEKGSFVFKFEYCSDSISISHTLPQKMLGNQLYSSKLVSDTIYISK